MSLFLIINTAVEPFGFSLHHQERCFVSIKYYHNRLFSESLLSIVDFYCREYQLSLRNIQGVGVVNGPGSYTGIRIGVSYAKTLSYSLQCPVVGISSLDALASQVMVYNSVFAIVMNAKPNYVYFQLFNRLHEDGVKAVSDLLLLSMDHFFDLIQSFQSDMPMYVSAKKSLFETFSHDYIKLIYLDIHCDALFPLLDASFKTYREGMLYDVKLNYICEPNLGA